MYAEIPKNLNATIESFRTAIKPILSSLIEKQVISIEDCNVLLESDLIISSRLTRLDDRGFNSMAR